MNFLSFLKTLEGKRQRTKRIVIYSLYLLAPIVILATALGNDRVMTKCENDIKQCQDRIKTLEARSNGGKPSEELSRLQNENKRLKDQLSSRRNPSNSSNEERINQLTKELENLENQLSSSKNTNDDLQGRLARAEQRLAAGSSQSQINSGVARDHKQEIEGLIAARDNCLKSRSALERENSRLERELRDCNARLARSAVTPQKPYEILVGSDFIKSSTIPPGDKRLEKLIYAGLSYKLVVNGETVAYFSCSQ